MYSDRNHKYSFLTIDICLFVSFHTDSPEFRQAMTLRKLQKVRGKDGRTFKSFTVHNACLLSRLDNAI